MAAVTGKVTTSIVVEFTPKDSTAILTVEVDDRDDGYNAGRTSFNPGDDVYLLLYKGSNVSLDNVRCSLGSLTRVATGVTIQKEKALAFEGTREATLDYPFAGWTKTPEWVGVDLGAITVVGDATATVPPVGHPPPYSIDERYPIGVALVEYNTTADVYKLTHTDPGMSKYSIVAFFLGHQI